MCVCVYVCVGLCISLRGAFQVCMQERKRVSSLNVLNVRQTELERKNYQKP